MAAGDTPQGLEREGRLLKRQYHLKAKAGRQNSKHSGYNASMCPTVGLRKAHYLHTRFNAARYLLLLFSVLYVSNIPMTASAMGPVRFFGGRFTWENTVDRADGVASSKEFSPFLPKDKFFQLQQQRHLLEQSENDYSSSGNSLLQLAEALLRTYPSYLCKWSVSMGLLRFRENEIRLLGIIPLLRFGNVRSQSLSYTTRKKNEEGSESVPIKTSRCVVHLPLVGGTLVPKITEKAHEKSKYVPSIRLMLTQHANEEVHATECELTTQLLNYPLRKDYKRINWIHAAWYTGTQAMIHAYVSWRFHRYCWNYSVKSREASKETSNSYSTQPATGLSAQSTKGFPTVSGVPISGIEVDWKERKLTVH